MFLLCLFDHPCRSKSPIVSSVTALWRMVISIQAQPKIYLITLRIATAETILSNMLWWSCETINLESSLYMHWTGFVSKLVYESLGRDFRSVIFSLFMLLHYVKTFLLLLKARSEFTAKKVKKCETNHETWSIKFYDVKCSKSLNSEENIAAKPNMCSLSEWKHIALKCFGAVCWCQLCEIFALCS